MIRNPLQVNLETVQRQETTGKQPQSRLRCLLRVNQCQQRQLVWLQEELDRRTIHTLNGNKTSEWHLRSFEPVSVFKPNQKYQVNEVQDKETFFFPKSSFKTSFIWVTFPLLYFRHRLLFALMDKDYNYFHKKVSSHLQVKISWLNWLSSKKTLICLKMNAFIGRTLSRRQSVVNSLLYSMLCDHHVFEGGRKQ